MPYPSSLRSFPDPPGLGTTQEVVALGPAGTLHGQFKIVTAQGHHVASTSSVVYLS